MKLATILIVSFIFCTVFAETDLMEKVKQDDSFIVPGFGANKVVLEENINYAIQRFKHNSFKLSKPRKISELFKDVLKISSKIQIYFDALYYNAENKFSICVFNNSIVAIIGTNVNKITIDFVDLNNGVNNFIFNYGNKNLYQISNGSHAIYYYLIKGIAVIDDDSNDTIDMYIVFKGRGSGGR